MKQIHLSDPIDPTVIEKLKNLKYMFDKEHTAWVRNFGTYDNFIDKLNGCHTNNDINKLVNPSWTSTTCLECDSIDDVIEFGENQYDAPYYRVCKKCMTTALKELL